MPEKNELGGLSRLPFVAARYQLKSGALLVKCNDGEHYRFNGGTSDLNRELGRLNRRTKILKALLEEAT